MLDVHLRETNCNCMHILLRALYFINIYYVYIIYNVIIVITRRDNNLLSNIIVSDFISDHRVLHASLTCQRPHPARKQIQVRALRRINDVALNGDLARIEIDTECGDVNTVAIQYDDCMRKLLDKHAPMKTIQVVERPMNDWINVDILELKIKRRRNESLWRRT